MVTPEAWLQRWRLALRVNATALSNPYFALMPMVARRVERAQRLFLEQHGQLLAARARAGRIVEGHGDLRPEHIWLGDGIRVIDCLEFNADLRRVDPLQELAYLDLECSRLGRSTVEQLRAAVCRRLGDGAPDALFLFYRCYAATLRARLAAAHTLDPSIRLPEKWLPLAKSYLGFGYADAVRLERLITAPEDRRSLRRGGAAVLRPRAAARRTKSQAGRPRL